MACRDDKLKRKVVQGTKYAVKDEASGQDIAASICHMAVYALMATGAVGAANATTPPQRKVCCSAIPNHCRRNVTCMEDDGISDKCEKASCHAIQYWVKEVNFNLNPSQ